MRRIYLVGPLSLLVLICASTLSQEQRPREERLRAERQEQQQQQRSEASLSIPSSKVIEIRASLPQEIRVGDSFQYQIHVANVSEDVMLHNVKLSQQVPQGLRVESAEIVAAGQSSQEGQRSPQQQQQRQQERQQQESQQQQDSQISQDGNWTIDQLGPGEAKTIVVTAAGDQEGPANLCLTVTSYTPSLCVATKFVKPELELVKEAPERAGLCEEIEFSYYVKNEGSGNIERFEVRDSLSPGLRTISGDPELRFEVEDGLKPGETRKFVAHLRAEEPGEFASRAVAVLPDGEQTRSARTATVVQAAQLDVAIEGPSTQYVERLTNYTVRVTNNGDIPSRDTLLLLQHPTSVRLVRVGEPRRASNPGSSASPNQNGQPTRASEEQQEQQQKRQQQQQQQAKQQQQQNARQQAGQRSERQAGVATEALELGALEPGQSVVVDFATVGENAGTVEYRALAEFPCAAGEQKDRVTALATTQTELIALSALAIAVVDDKDPVAVGDELIYTVGVKNEGEAPDQEVRITAELPEGLEFVEATGATKGQHEGQKITFEPVPELAPGDQVEWKIRTKVTKQSEAQLTAKLTSKNHKREVTAEEPTKLFEDTQAAQKPQAETRQQ